MTRFYIPINANGYVSFSAPNSNYSALLADLGIVIEPPTGTRLKGSVFNYPVAAFRVTLDTTPPKSGRVLCAPSKAGTAPAALTGKLYKTFAILEANPVRHRTVTP